MTLLLGIDVGTSSAKAVLIDGQGALLGAASCNHPTVSDGPDHQEQAANDWWRGVCASVRQVLAMTGADPRAIAGLSLSGQGCACLPVDADGIPLSRALIWTDTRAAEQAARIRAAFGDRLGALTGNDLYDQPEPRMLWLRDHAPELYARTATFHSTVSYLLFRFSGVVAANTSDWGYHLAFDRIRRDWNRDFLREVGLESSRFPRLVAPHEVVARVTAGAAAECGLVAGIPVVAGGQDATLSALAVGALAPGQSVFMRGTTDLVSVCTTDPGYHPGLYTTCAVLPGRYMAYDMQAVVAAGGSYRWLAQLLFGAVEDGCYDALNRLAEAAPAGARGVFFLPYLLVPTMAALSAGRSGAFHGLTIATERGDLCRAVLEGTAYALREALARMAAGGVTITELRATGGPTRSRLWNQIMADVCGLPLLVSGAAGGAANGAACGAALLAGLGVGVIPMDDDDAGLRRAILPGECCLPDPALRPFYDRAYARFVDLVVATAGLPRT